MIFRKSSRTLSDKRGSNDGRLARAADFREWIGRSYENAGRPTADRLHDVFEKKIHLPQKPGSGPCPRYSNGGHCYRCNCRCYWQRPDYTAAWYRYVKAMAIADIHFSDVFISSARASLESTARSSRGIVRLSFWIRRQSIRRVVWLSTRLSPIRFRLLANFSQERRNRQFQATTSTNSMSDRWNCSSGRPTLKT